MTAQTAGLDQGRDSIHHRPLSDEANLPRNRIVLFHLLSVPYCHTICGRRDWTATTRCNLRRRRLATSSASALIYERRGSVIIAFWRRPPTWRDPPSSPLSRPSHRRRVMYVPLISVLKIVWPWIVVQMLCSVSRPTQKPANKQTHHHHHCHHQRRLGHGRIAGRLGIACYYNI